MNILESHVVEVVDAIKIQNEFMVNLVLSDNIDVTNNMILIALHTRDWHILELLSSHLNANKKYYKKFHLRSQELSCIVKMDNVNLIEAFQYFIEADTICCVLNVIIKNMEGLNCLKKILSLKIIRRPHHLYMLLKIIGNKRVENTTIGNYITKRMIDYAISDKNYKILNFVLSQLVKKTSVNDMNKLIQQYLTKGYDKKYNQILNKYYFKGIINHKIKTIRI